MDNVVLMPDSRVSDLKIEDLNLRNNFTTPTNQASITYHQGDCLLRNNVRTDCCTFPVPVKSVILDTYVHSPWQPVSKGDIKKCAQTRFVNSSPKSYRLMPASVESSETDRTSFVEKASHKFLLPVSYFLEIANLWALSNRSELECRFTFANTESNQKLPPVMQDTLEEDKRRPICHTKALPPVKSSEKNILNNNVAAENELLQSVNRFLETCQRKDKSSIENSGLPEPDNDVGSETRRYLSKIVSLMNKKFAVKLQNRLNKNSGQHESRKRCLNGQGGSPNKKTKKSPCVDVFTMSSTEQDESDNEQFVIIRIPTGQHKSPNHYEKRKTIDLPTVAENTRKNNNPHVDPKMPDLDVPVDEENIEGKKPPNCFSTSKRTNNCFYCELSFNEKSSCARHMLSHLASKIETACCD